VFNVTFLRIDFHDTNRIEKSKENWFAIDRPDHLLSITLISVAVSKRFACLIGLFFKTNVLQIKI
jgi:hypothetical protein